MIPTPEEAARKREQRRSDRTEWAAGVIRSAVVKQIDKGRFELACKALFAPPQADVFTQGAWLGLQGQGQGAAPPPHDDYSDVVEAAARAVAKELEAKGWVPAWVDDPCVLRWCEGVGGRP